MAQVNLLVLYQHLKEAKLDKDNIRAHGYRMRATIGEATVILLLFFSYMKTYCALH